MPDAVRIPDPALVVLVGASGAGKSTWAAKRYRAAEIVSSDDLRGIVGSGPHDLDASIDAFGLLDQIVGARIRRGLTTVVDTLGLDAGRRRGYRELARRASLPAVAVIFTTPAAVCRQRNRERARPVPAPVLTSQLRAVRQVTDPVAAEGWDLVIALDDARVSTGDSTGESTGESAGNSASGPVAPIETAIATGTRKRPAEVASRLAVVLQISRFPWKEDPAGWLKAVATAASEVGFSGLALMDHLIQVPQVGRAWEPIPEPWVTLGLLAGLDTELRLGTLVSPVTFRRPGITAKAVATLDVLTGGRAFCGVGAGWWQREHSAFGLPFPPTRERLDLLEAGIETMRALWSRGTKEYAGRHVRLPETTCYPRPVSKVPIIVGGGGERRTLRIAARLADGCNVSSDPDLLDRKIAALNRHCDDVGRPRDEVAVTVLDLPIVGVDREHAWSTVERLRGRTSATAFARRHYAGTVTDHVTRYRMLADKGVSTVFLALPDLATAEDVERLAPLLARLD
jgi:alkanesulfonate monooxygenase SsuD/methylene tetrahydromethanopterin reductase-like flavin-dependent oxidoreductase (luciferase family)/predicted kinase